MAAREEEDKGSQLVLFPLHSTTALNILTAKSQSYEFYFFFCFATERAGELGV